MKKIIRVLVFLSVLSLSAMQESRIRTLVRQQELTLIMQQQVRYKELWEQDALTVEFVHTMHSIFAGFTDAQKKIKRLKGTYLDFVSSIHELCCKKPLFFLKKMIKKDGYTTKSGVKQQVITSNLYCVLLFNWLMQTTTQKEKNDLLEYAFDIGSYYTMIRFLIALGARIKG